MLTIEEVADCYRRDRRKIFLFICRYRSGREAEAEEIVQDAFLTALTKRESFNGESALSTWINSIALNLLKNKFRQEKKMPFVDVYHADDLPGNFDDGFDLESMLDLRADPARICENRSDIEKADAALDNLFSCGIRRRCAPAKQKLHKAIFVSWLNTGMGLTGSSHKVDEYQLIADEHRVPVGTAKSSISRTRKKIKEAICES
jgi:RNA polymerase sigma factor (sigma-70 family)